MKICASCEASCTTIRSVMASQGLFSHSIKHIPCNPDNGMQAKFTDILIYPFLTTRGPPTTDSYDRSRRREPNFRSRLQPYKMPHAYADTVLILSRNAKANVFTSQFIRYSRMIQNLANFVCEIANLILYLGNIGHDKKALLAKCHAMLRDSPWLYCVGEQQCIQRAHFSGLFRQICRRVQCGLSTSDV